jgi:hypothetical protein
MVHRPVYDDALYPGAPGSLNTCLNLAQASTWPERLDAR